MVAWGDVAACLFMTAHVTENVKVVFAKQISNLALIPHRLTVTVSLLWRLGPLTATVMTPPRAIKYQAIFENSLGK